jgi:hypothetical protein
MQSLPVELVLRLDEPDGKEQKRLRNGAEFLRVKADIAAKGGLRTIQLCVL